MGQILEKTLAITVSFPIDFVDEMLVEGLRKHARGKYGRMEDVFREQGYQDNFERQPNSTVLQTATLKGVKSTVLYSLKPLGPNNTKITRRSLAIEGMPKNPNFLVRSFSNHLNRKVYEDWGKQFEEYLTLHAKARGLSIASGRTL